MRDGSAIFESEDLQRPISVGGFMLIAPNALAAYQPEGEATVSTLLIDTDYLIAHLLWQHLDLIPDRDADRDRASSGAHAQRHSEAVAHPRPRRARLPLAQPVRAGLPRLVQSHAAGASHDPARVSNGSPAA